MLATVLVVQQSAFGAVVPSPAPAATPTPVVGTKEPLIEVSVDTLEISESNSNVLGILWGDVNAPSSNRINFIERSVPSIFNVGQFDRVRLQAQLDAMIKNDQARILANPTLLTKSGFEASFLVGGEIPYPTVGQGGVAGVEFKKYGVALKILPTMTPRSTIEAQINIGVTAPDNSVARDVGGVSTPGLSSREASSKVEVNDGETVVMAGIKQSRREKSIVKVPLLGYIPLIGLLFTHKTENVTQTSLVLFVTFRLIK